MIELRTFRPRRYFRHVFALTLLLVSACQSQGHTTSIPAVQSAVVAPQGSAPTLGVPATRESSPSQGCYYVWATRELPDLTRALTARLEGLQPDLQGSAYAFGEECHSDSGTATFLAMETDFRIRALVPALEDEEALGNAIYTAMMIIDKLPAEQMAGTRPGRVEFEFVDESSKSLRLMIDITTYRQTAAGKQGAALYRLFRPAG